MSPKITSVTPWSAWCDLAEEDGAHTGDTREQAIDRACSLAAEILEGNGMDEPTEGIVWLDRDVSWHRRCKDEDCTACGDDVDWAEIAVSRTRAGYVKVMFTWEDAGDITWGIWEVTP